MVPSAIQWRVMNENPEVEIAGRSYDLEEENERLRAENARLRGMLGLPQGRGRTRGGSAPKAAGIMHLASAIPSVGRMSILRAPGRIWTGSFRTAGLTSLA